MKLAVILSISEDNEHDDSKRPFLPRSCVGYTTSVGIRTICRKVPIFVTILLYIELLNLNLNLFLQCTSHELCEETLLAKNDRKVPEKIDILAFY